MNSSYLVGLLSALLFIYHRNPEEPKLICGGTLLKPGRIKMNVKRGVIGHNEGFLWSSMDQLITQS